MAVVVHQSRHGDRASDPASSGAAASRPQRRISPAWAVVAVAVAWNLVTLREQTVAVPYQNDGALHEQMVRFAVHLISGGHFPLTSWFPYLGLGSPQFLHYQSLPAMLTALAGLVVGANVAFRWSLYLLLSLWPLSVYFGARLLGLRRGAAAAAALMSPFVMSITKVGYEQDAYVWSGIGLWAQLWAMVTLPLAWGFTWRAIRYGKNVAAAVCLTALTVALHFETGYLALMPLVLWPFVTRRDVLARLRRTAIILTGVALGTAWVIVPLIQQRNWASINERFQVSVFMRGSGAGAVLEWLVRGQVLDYQRLPVITILTAVGFLVICVRWRRQPNARALVLVFFGALVLSFGPSTLGVFAHLIPGSRDLFFRRFLMGSQLAALMVAGLGAEWALARTGAAISAAIHRRPRLALTDRRRRAVMLAAGSAAAGLALMPAWLQLLDFDRQDATYIRAQQAADSAQGAQLDTLIETAKRGGGGRVYGGNLYNWGANFGVGYVTVFQYLAHRDADGVGFTLRTASLMTNPEYYMDDQQPSDYSIFGIRYLILPKGWRPPVPARFTRAAGSYALWTVAAGHYFHVGTTAGSVSEDRSNIGTQNYYYLRSPLAGHGVYPTVSYGVRTTSANMLPAPARGAPVGDVLEERANLVSGKATTTVRLRRPGVVVLSASFDPGWQATVDGRRVVPRMVAPALVSARVPSGVHTVSFHYEGLHDYPELLALAVLAVGTITLLELRRRRRRDLDAPLIPAL